MRAISNCTAIGLLAVLTGCTRDLYVEQASNSAGHGNGHDTTVGENGSNNPSSTGRMAKATDPKEDSESLGQGGTSDSGATSARGGASSVGGFADPGGMSNSAGAPPYAGAGTLPEEVNHGQEGFLCSSVTRATMEFYAPLPQDQSLWKGMNYELCINDSCLVLVHPTGDLFVPGSSISSEMFIGPSHSVEVDFMPIEASCSTSCTPPIYQLLVQTVTTANWRPSDGDVWSLGLFNADGTLYYERTVSATYTPKYLQGGGDFQDRYATCNMLSVPIGDANDPSFAGCRAPSEPGCNTCCVQGTSTTDEGPVCITYLTLAGVDWYVRQTKAGTTCPSTCAPCAQCKLRDEQQLRALVRPDGCDCSTADIGTDPCFEPNSCECYCQLYGVGTLSCPLVMPQTN